MQMLIFDSQETISFEILRKWNQNVIAFSGKFRCIVIGVIMYYNERMLVTARGISKQDLDKCIID